MSSKIKIDNASGQVLVDDQSIAALAITSSAQGAGQTLISDSNLTWSYQDAYLSWRNKIINGDMAIDQRNSGAAVTTTLAYPVDRFRIVKDSAAVVSVARTSATVPAGFSNSMAWTVTTGGNTTTSQGAGIQQLIEGSNITEFSFGSSSAKAITLSFWVRSSVTGTYCITISNAVDRSYIKEYTISAANTWEYKTMTIPGDTAGTWLKTNGRGMLISFDLGSGPTLASTANSWLAGDFNHTSNQVNFIGTTGATFYLTGVQLELGTVATPFEYLPYSESLNLCKRYFAKYSATSSSSVFGAGSWATTTLGYVFLKYEQQMRSAPTITLSGMTLSNGAQKTYSSTGTIYAGTDSALIGVNTSTTAVAGHGAILQASSASGYITISSEL